MKIGWLVVGVVSLLAISTMVVSRPSAFTPRLQPLIGSAPAAEWTPGEQQPPAQPVVEPTIVRTQSPGETPVPHGPCQPCSAVDEAPLEWSEPPATLSSEPISVDRTLLRMLFPALPTGVAPAPQPELAPPPICLPTGGTQTQ
ncbi:MAG: hypothetical protein J5I93_12785 [Pirellulaceae bacterium]|nr:hypothetical protein [Pirellulaceae bacterium]